MHIKSIWQVCIGFALFLCACTAPDSAKSASTTLSLNHDIVLRIHLSVVGPAVTAEGDRAMAELGNQIQSGLDSPVHFIDGALPPNPRFGEEVVIRFAITQKGTVYNLQSIEDRARKDLVFATIRSMSSWHFTPPMHDGRPTDICCIKITFY